MTRRLRVAIPAAVACLASAPAPAEICTIDTVPAATLLLPYFEVNLGKATGSNTIFSIANVDAAATVAHVTLWTNWAVPTLAFDVFLTGYDVQSIDLRELFEAGALPQTAHRRNDPEDLVSPHGGAHSDNPEWDSGASAFPDCDPLLPPAPLGQAQRDFLKNAHTGRNVGDGCVAAALGDNVARGYITVDDVDDCSLLFPGEIGYFTNVASGENTLWGQSYLSDSRTSLAAAPLVPIERAPAVGAYTFYRRYGSTSDGLEPLGTTWAVRYVAGKARLGGRNVPVATDLVVWRDPFNSNLAVRYACGMQQPAWAPMQETQVVAFDDREDAIEMCFDADPATDPACMPLATQRVRLGSGDLRLPFSAGWIYLNLNTDNEIRQSHVAGLLVSKKIRSTSAAVELTSACGS